MTRAHSRVAVEVDYCILCGRSFKKKVAPAEVPSTSDPTADLIASRNERYGDPAEWYPRIAARWSEYLGVEVKGSDVGFLMEIFKDERNTREIELNADPSDSVGDRAAYRRIAENLKEAGI